MTLRQALGLWQTRLEAGEASPPILQICGEKDSGKTMGNSEDKDGLATGSLTLPPHTPGRGLPGPRSFSWLHLAAFGGGGVSGKPCDSLKVT